MGLGYCETKLAAIHLLSILQNIRTNHFSNMSCINFLNVGFPLSAFVARQAHFVLYSVYW